MLSLELRSLRNPGIVVIAASQPVRLLSRSSDLNFKLTMGTVPPSSSFAKLTLDHSILPDPSLAPLHPSMARSGILPI